MDINETISRPLQIMRQSLRRTPADPCLPDIYEVPVQPAGGGNIVAVVYGNSSSSGEASKNEALAYAALFAAAPELLAALREITEHPSAFSDGASRLWKQALAAIAKAEGTGA